MPLSWIIVVAVAWLLNAAVGSVCASPPVSAASVRIPDLPGVTPTAPLSPGSPGTRGGGPAPSASLAVTLDRAPPAYRGLIHDNRTRQSRTLSVELDRDTRLQGFTARPADRRLDLVRPAPAKDYRLEGAVLTHRIDGSDGVEVDLGGAWVRGRQWRGDWLAPLDRVDTDAWSLNGEATAWDDQVALSLEYAGTRSMRRGESGSAGSTGSVGVARRGDLSLRPDTTGPATWEFGASYEDTGIGFASLANPGLGADQTRLATFGRVRLGAWGLDVRYREDEGGSEAQAPIARTRWRRADLAGTWEPDVDGLPALLGNPRFRLSTLFGLREVDRTEEQRPAAPEDPVQADLRFGSAFATPFGDWEVDVRRRRLPGTLAETQPSGLRSTRVGLSARRFALAGLPARSALAWERAQAPAGGERKDTWSAEFALERLALGERLVAGLDLRLRERFDAHGRKAAQRVAGTLEWTSPTPIGSAGGLRLSITGAWLTGQSHWLAVDGEPDYHLQLQIAVGDTAAAD